MTSPSSFALSIYRELPIQHSIGADIIMQLDDVGKWS
jgi:queuine/archaeosine tRNA-ribosyltransferase